MNVLDMFSWVELGGAVCWWTGIGAVAVFGQWRPALARWCVVLLSALPIWRVVTSPGARLVVRLFPGSGTLNMGTLAPNHL